MMTFLDSGLATTSGEFQLRIQAAVFKLAQDVLNEGGDPDSDRHALATEAVQQPGTVAPRFLWLCAANPTIAGTVSVANGEVTVGAPDSDIEYVIASNWDVVAGR